MDQARRLIIFLLLKFILQSIYTRAAPGIIMGGVLPFGCIFIQLFFILNSIWYVIELSWKQSCGYL